MVSEIEREGREGERWRERVGGEKEGGWGREREEGGGERNV